MSGDSTEQKIPPRRLWFGLVLIAVVLAQIVYGFVIFRVFGSDMAVRGQFGDLFGAVNALFTGLAFAGVIYTILLQRHELELQRDELRLTREELHTSAVAQTEQASHLQETTNLSALTALLNVYSTDLQPLREITREPREQLAHRRALLQKHGDVSHSQRSGWETDIRIFEGQIVDQEAEWRTVLDKHHSLVKKLEASVERVNQGGSFVPDGDHESQ